MFTFLIAPPLPMATLNMSGIAGTDVINGLACPLCSFFYKIMLWHFFFLDFLLQGMNAKGAHLEVWNQILPYSVWQFLPANILTCWFKMWPCDNDWSINFSSVLNSLECHSILIKPFEEMGLVRIHMYHFNHLFFEEIIQIHWNILSLFPKAAWLKSKEILYVIYKQPVPMHSVKGWDYQRMREIQKAMFDLWGKTHVSLMPFHATALIRGRLRHINAFPKKKGRWGITGK